MSAAPGALAQAGTFAALLGRNLRQMPRIPTVLVFGIVMPVVQLALFGSIFSSVTAIPGNPYQGVNYYAYIAPAIVLLTAFMGMANVSAALIVDLRTGYFDKLRTTPASGATILGARVAADMARVALQCVVVLLLAAALGATVATGLAGAAAMIVLAVVFSAATVAPLVMVLAMRTKSDQATQSAFPLFFVLLFLSTAYMPAPLLPSWLREVVRWNPIDYVIRSLRTLMLQGWPLDDIAVALGASLAAAVVLGLAVRRTYRAVTA